MSTTCLQQKLLHYSLCTGRLTTEILVSELGVLVMHLSIFSFHFREICVARTIVIEL